MLATIQSGPIVGCRSITQKVFGLFVHISAQAKRLPAGASTSRTKVNVAIYMTEKQHGELDPDTATRDNNDAPYPDTISGKWNVNSGAHYQTCIVCIMALK